MFKNIYSVLDAKSGVFGSPVFVPHAGVILRSFTDEVNNPAASDLYKHSEDFALYEIGTFDDSQGVITPHSIPKLIVQASSLKTSV